jgi:hypothetical protein
MRKNLYPANMWRNLKYYAQKSSTCIELELIIKTTGSLEEKLATLKLLKIRSILHFRHIQQDKKTNMVNIVKSKQKKRKKK